MPRIKITTMKLNDKFKVGKYECTAAGDDNYGYYLYVSGRTSNSGVHTQFGVTGKEIHELKHHSKESSGFPPHKTLQDLEKTVKYLRRKWLMHPDFKVVVRVHSAYQRDVVIKEFNLYYSSIFDEPFPLQMQVKTSTYTSDSDWYKNKGFEVLEFNDVFETTKEKVMRYQVKDKFKDIAEKLTDIKPIGQFTKGSITYNRLDEWNLIDLWCEVVPESVVVNMGSFNLEIKDGRAFHKGKDETSFIVEFVERFYHTDKTNTALKYDFDIDLESLKFSFVGCEKSTTKFSDWKKVYDLITV